MDNKKSGGNSWFSGLFGGGGKKSSATASPASASSSPVAAATSNNDKNNSTGELKIESPTSAKRVMESGGAPKSPRMPLLRRASSLDSSSSTHSMHANVDPLLEATSLKYAMNIEEVLPHAFVRKLLQENDNAEGGAGGATKESSEPNDNVFIQGKLNDLIHFLTITLTEENAFHSSAGHHGVTLAEHLLQCVAFVNSQTRVEGEGESLRKCHDMLCNWLQYICKKNDLLLGSNKFRHRFLVLLEFEYSPAQPEKQEVLKAILLSINFQNASREDRISLVNDLAERVKQKPTLVHLLPELFHALLSSPPLTHIATPPGSGKRTSMLGLPLSPPVNSVLDPALVAFEAREAYDAIYRHLISKSSGIGVDEKERIIGAVGLLISIGGPPDEYLVAMKRAEAENSNEPLNEIRNNAAFAVIARLINDLCAYEERQEEKETPQPQQQQQQDDDLAVLGLPVLHCLMNVYQSNPRNFGILERQFSCLSTLSRNLGSTRSSNEFVFMTVKIFEIVALGLDYRPVTAVKALTERAFPELIERNDVERFQLLANTLGKVLQRHPSLLVDANLLKLVLLPIYEKHPSEILRLHPQVFLECNQMLASCVNIGNIHAGGNGAKLLEQISQNCQACLAARLPEKFTLFVKFLLTERVETQYEFFMHPPSNNDNALWEYCKSVLGVQFLLTLFDPEVTLQAYGELLVVAKLESARFALTNTYRTHLLGMLVSLFRNDVVGGYARLTWKSLNGFRAWLLPLMRECISDWEGEASAEDDSMSGYFNIIQLLLNCFICSLPKDQEKVGLALDKKNTNANVVDDAKTNVVEEEEEDKEGGERQESKEPNNKSFASIGAMCNSLHDVLKTAVLWKRPETCLKLIDYILNACVSPNNVEMLDRFELLHLLGADYGEFPSLACQQFLLMRLSAFVAHDGQLADWNREQLAKARVGEIIVKSFPQCMYDDALPLHELSTRIVACIGSHCATPTLVDTLVRLAYRITPGDADGASEVLSALTSNLVPDERKSARQLETILDVLHRIAQPKVTGRHVCLGLDNDQFVSFSIYSPAAILLSSNIIGNEKNLFLGSTSASNNKVWPPDSGCYSISFWFFVPPQSPMMLFHQPTEDVLIPLLSLRAPTNNKELLEVGLFRSREVVDPTVGYQLQLRSPIAPHCVNIDSRTLAAGKWHHVVLTHRHLEQKTLVSGLVSKVLGKEHQSNESAALNFSEGRCEVFVNGASLNHANLSVVAWPPMVLSELAIQLGGGGSVRIASCIIIDGSLERNCISSLWIRGPNYRGTLSKSNPSFQDRRAIFASVCERLLLLLNAEEDDADMLYRVIKLGSHELDARNVYKFLSNCLNSIIPANLIIFHLDARIKEMKEKVVTPLPLQDSLSSFGGATPVFFPLLMRLAVQSQELSRLIPSVITLVRDSIRGSDRLKSAFRLEDGHRTLGWLLFTYCTTSPNVSHVETLRAVLSFCILGNGFDATITDAEAILYLVLNQQIWKSSSAGGWFGILFEFLPWCERLLHPMNKHRSLNYSLLEPLGITDWTMNAMLLLMVEDVPNVNLHDLFALCESMLDCLLRCSMDFSSDGESASFPHVCSTVFENVLVTLSTSKAYATAEDTRESASLSGLSERFKYSEYFGEYSNSQIVRNCLLFALVRVRRKCPVERFRSLVDVFDTLMTEEWLMTFCDAAEDDPSLLSFLHLLETQLFHSPELGKRLAASGGFEYVSSALNEFSRNCNVCVFWCKLVALGGCNVRFEGEGACVKVVDAGALEAELSRILDCVSDTTVPSEWRRDNAFEGLQCLLQENHSGELGGVNVMVIEFLGKCLKKSKHLLKAWAGPAPIRSVLKTIFLFKSFEDATKLSRKTSNSSDSSVGTMLDEAAEAEIGKLRLTVNTQDTNEDDSFLPAEGEVQSVELKLMIAFLVDLILNSYSDPVGVIANACTLFPDTISPQQVVWFHGCLFREMVKHPVFVANAPVLTACVVYLIQRASVGWMPKLEYSLVDECLTNPILSAHAGVLLNVKVLVLSFLQRQGELFNTMERQRKHEDAFFDVVEKHLDKLLAFKPDRDAFVGCLFYLLLDPATAQALTNEQVEVDDNFVTVTPAESGKNPAQVRSSKSALRLFLAVAKSNVDVLKHALFHPGAVASNEQTANLLANVQQAKDALTHPDAVGEAWLRNYSQSLRAVLMSNLSPVWLKDFDRAGGRFYLTSRVSVPHTMQNASYVNWVSFLMSSTKSVKKLAPITPSSNRDGRSGSFFSSSTNSDAFEGPEAKRRARVERVRALQRETGGKIEKWWLARYEDLIRGEKRFAAVLRKSELPTSPWEPFNGRHVELEEANIRWKLDPFEDPTRARRKLRMNRSFFKRYNLLKSHPSASTKPIASSGITGAMRKLEPVAQTGLKRPSSMRIFRDKIEVPRPSTPKLSGSEHQRRRKRPEDGFAKTDSAESPTLSSPPTPRSPGSKKTAPPAVLEAPALFRSQSKGSEGSQRMRSQTLVKGEEESLEVEDEAVPVHSPEEKELGERPSEEREEDFIVVPVEQISANLEKVKAEMDAQDRDAAFLLQNCSSVRGLEERKGLCLIAKCALYVVDHYEKDGNGEVVEIDEKSSTFNVQLLSSDKSLQSQPSSEAPGGGGKKASVSHRKRKVRYVDILDLHKRRFLFREVALEIFCSDGASLMIVCESKSERDSLQQHIKKAIRKNVAETFSPFTPIKPFSVVTVDLFQGTKKWLAGALTNFDYLTLLNTFAGRSYNDPVQYLVFPWILADYESAKLNLDLAETYRRLNTPMGALTEERRQWFEERYQLLDSTSEASGIAPFHYGMHYSCSGFVANFLFRLEPFSRMALQLQGGTFDKADRLFRNVDATWKSASGLDKNAQDVRELVPEFFYNAEFLKNRNQFDLGKTQKGLEVGDVELPPWANGSAKEFVRISRKALESKFVSEHLHEWIDLIFGYKQRGREAIAALNVFHPLTYEGEVEVESIQNPIAKNAMLSQIHEFGQTPRRLFDSPHPKRVVPDISNGSTFDFSWHYGLAPALVIPGVCYSPPKSAKLVQTEVANASINLIGINPGDCLLSLSGECDLKAPTIFNGDFHQSIIIAPQDKHFALISDLFMDDSDKIHVGKASANGVATQFVRTQNNCYLLYGSDDGSIEFHLINSSSIIASGGDKVLGTFENLHVGSISFCCVLDDGRMVLTTGEDGVIAFWRIVRHHKSFEWKLEQDSIHVGHSADESITCVCVCREQGVFLSASTDGNIISWDLARKEYTRTFRARDGAIKHMGVNALNGNIISVTSHSMRMWDINGDCLARLGNMEDIGYGPITTLHVTNLHNYQYGIAAVVGHASGFVSLWDVLYLEDAEGQRGEFECTFRLRAVVRVKSAPIAKIACSKDQRSIVVCDVNGYLKKWTSLDKKFL